MTQPQHPQDGPLAAYYAGLSDEADPARRVSWRACWDQQLRFEVLCEILGGAPRQPAPTLLDVGCGLGDLLPFLERRGQAVRYVGVDVLPEMVARARLRHPGQRFEVHDLLTDGDPPGGPFDYVFASGTLSVRGPDHEAHVRHMLERMFELCRYGLAVNFQSARVRGRYAPGEQDRDIYYADPLATYAFCRTLTPRTVLREDVFPTDFAVLLFRGPSSAHRRYRQLVQRAPPLPNWPVGLASLCLEQGLAEQGLAVLEHATPGAAEANYRGLCLLHLGRPEQALDPLRRAVRLDPDGMDAPVNLGVALNMVGQADEAADAWEQALHRRPDNDSARARLASWALEHGQLERVEALAANLADPVERDLLGGLAAARRGDLVAARARLQAAAERDPNHARARLELATVHERLGEEGEAAERYLQVLQRVPGHRQARRSLRALALRRRGQGSGAGAPLRATLARWQAAGVGEWVGRLLAVLDR